MNILIAFRCGCGYQEDIGVDVHCGIVLAGSVTLVCPQCGAIQMIENVRAAVSVKFRLVPRPPVDPRAPT